MKEQQKPLEITKQQLEEQLRAQASGAHQQWLEHPVTRQFIQLLYKHRDHSVGQMNGVVSNISVPDSSFRQLGVHVANTSTILKLATDTETYVNYLFSKKD